MTPKTKHCVRTGRKRRWSVRVGTVAATLALLWTTARAAPPSPAMLVRWYTLGLDYERAEQVMRLQPIATKEMTIERGRLLIYETRYDEATETLEQPSVRDDPAAMRLATIARNSARSIAGAYVVTDLEHDLVVRLQDRRDQVLIPLMGETVQKARAALRQNLGVELPRPLHVEVVQDQFSLSAMTGLPLKSAQTTGTVAIANWGRVTIVSPRSIAHGYPWLDTLAHELTHVALGKGTHDQAPLWLQEGVAKHMETRWRKPWPWDHHPSPDDVSLAGERLGLGRQFDKLGPSVAMLPSAREAQVVFAQVQSFIGYVVTNAPKGTLRAIVEHVDTRHGDEGIDEGLKEHTGRGLAEWKKSWREYLRTRPDTAWRDLFKHHDLNLTNQAHWRLAKLLFDEGHGEQVPTLLGKSEDQRDWEHKALAAWQLGNLDEAKTLLKRLPAGAMPSPRSMVILGRIALANDRAEEAERWFYRALAFEPGDELVACELRKAPELPRDPVRAVLCAAARAESGGS